MKNILVIGVVSLVLFSVSAALSVWLQSNKKTETTASGDEKAAGKKKEADHTSDKEGKGGSDHGEPTAPDKPPTVLKPVDHGPKDRDDRAELRRIQIEVIQKEMRTQNEEISKRLKQLSVELKALQAEAEANDAQLKVVQQVEQKNKQKEAELDKKFGQLKKADQASYVVPGTIAEQMDPIKLAEMITLKADEGQLDDAVKMLLQMKHSKVAKIILEMKDSSLQNKVMDRIRELTAEKSITSK